MTAGFSVIINAREEHIDQKSYPVVGGSDRHRHRPAVRHRTIVSPGLFDKGFGTDRINNSGAGSDIVADINKDGAMDIVTATRFGTFVFWGKPRAFRPCS